MRANAIVLSTVVIVACGTTFDGESTEEAFEAAGEEPNGGTGGGIGVGGANSTGGTGGIPTSCPNGSSPVSVTLQAGVTIPVGSAYDTWIDEANPSAVNFGSTVCNVTGYYPLSGGKDRSCLLRWNISQIVPPGKVVLDAWLQVTIFDSSQSSYPVQFLLRSWDPFVANWVQASSSQNWSVPGAKGSQDRLGSYFGIVPAGTPIGTAIVPATGVSVQKVQDWVNNPSSNFGLIIAHETNTDNLRIRSSSSATAAERPGLGIKYCP